MPHLARYDHLSLHLTRASAVSMAVRVTGLVLAFLCHLVLSRALGANEYGQYMIAVGWAMVLVIPSRMGLDNSVLRFATIYREQGKAGDFRGLIRFSLGAISVAGAVIVAILLLAKADAVPPLVPISWGLIAGMALLVPSLAILGWMSALVRTANYIFASQFYEQVFRPLLLMAAVVVAILAGGGINSGQAMLLTGATVIFVTVGLGIHARRIFAGLPPGRPSFEHRSEWLTVSWPLFLMAIIQELLNQVDLILLGLLSNATQAAYFAASMRLASLVTFGLVAIGTVSAPLIASAYNRNDLGELARIATMSARFATMVAATVAAVLVIAGKPALGLFGPGFDNAYPALLVLLVGGVANSVTGTVGYLLTMTGRERAAPAILAGALSVNIASSLVLIPLFGAVGAACASTLGLVTWNVTMAIYMRRSLGVDATALGRARAGAG